jgi:hypothetical protein
MTKNAFTPSGNSKTQRHFGIFEEHTTQVFSGSLGTAEIRHSVTSFRVDLIEVYHGEGRKKRKLKR